MSRNQSPALTILLSESAERPFLSLAPGVRAQLQRIIENIAALAAVAPPIDPLWLKLPHFRTPVLRFSYSGVDVFYEVDLEAKLLRLTGVRASEMLDLAG